MFRFLHLLCLTASLGVLSCEGGSGPFEHSEEPDSPLGLPSEEMAASIYLDATLSMEGYVWEGSSNYLKTIELLEGAVTSGWPSGEANFFRFGTQVEPISGRGHLEATSPAFYHDSTINRETYIDSVLVELAPGQMIVVITDLFQADNDITLLAAQLRDRYIRNGLAIALIGVRSQFSGVVYDVGINRSKFSYTSANADPDTFRPFYAIVIGQHANVAHYVEQLKNLGLPDPSNIVILSSNIVNPVLTFKMSKVDSLSMTMIEDRGIVTSNPEDPRVREFRLRDEKGWMVTSISYKSLRVQYVPGFQADALELVVEARKILGIDSLGVAVVNPDNVAITASGLNDGGAALRWEIDFSGNRESGLHRYEVYVRPSSTAYIIPQWVQEWDMPQDMIPRWQMEPRQFDGSTTLNIHKFVQQVWTSTVQVHRPFIAHFFCYIETN